MDRITVEATIDITVDVIQTRTYKRTVSVEDVERALRGVGCFPSPRGTREALGHYIDRLMARVEEYPNAANSLADGGDLADEDASATMDVRTRLETYAWDPIITPAQ